VPEQTSTVSLLKPLSSVTVIVPFLPPFQKTGGDAYSEPFLDFCILQFYSKG